MGPALNRLKILGHRRRVDVAVLLLAVKLPRVLVDLLHFFPLEDFLHWPQVVGLILRRQLILLRQSMAEL
jgi:hypothetical protein